MRKDGRRPVTKYSLRQRDERETKAQIMYRFMVRFIKQNGRAPLYKELMQEMGVRSTSTIDRYLTTLHFQNKIRLGNGRYPKSLQIISDQSE